MLGKHAREITKERKQDKENKTNRTKEIEQKNIEQKKDNLQNQEDYISDRTEKERTKGLCEKDIDK